MSIFRKFNASFQLFMFKLKNCLFCSRKRNMNRINVESDVSDLSESEENYTENSTDSDSSCNSSKKQRKNIKKHKRKKKKRKSNEEKENRYINQDNTESNKVKDCSSSKSVQSLVTVEQSVGEKDDYTEYILSSYTDLEEKNDHDDTVIDDRKKFHHKSDVNLNYKIPFKRNPYNHDSIESSSSNVSISSEDQSFGCKKINFMKTSNYSNFVENDEIIGREKEILKKMKKFLFKKTTKKKN